jgi:H+-transporting ATPase
MTRTTKEHRLARSSAVSPETSPHPDPPSEPTATGLTEAEVRSRRERFGPNEIEEETRRPWSRLLGYFNGPIPWMIEAAALLSIAVGDTADFAIILALLLLNAGIAFLEEYQADRTLAALKRQLALRARVKREGCWTTVPARDLVPGDIVRVRLGDVVPADAEILEGDRIDLDRSALTGESMPVAVGPGERIFSGSRVIRGEIDARVTATGRDTYFGKTAALVESTRTSSHLQRALLRIGRYLIGLALGMVVLILVAGIVRDESLVRVLRFALVLTVAAIPAALPTVLSVTMAVGARRLSREKAVVRRLSAIEELAGVDVLVSDKTGTLTSNRLDLREPFVFDRADANEVLRLAAFASRAEDGDPIDRALLDAVPAPASGDGGEVVRFRPFDPVRKRTEATVRRPDGTEFRVAKGAPQVILALADTPARIADRFHRVIESFASRGFRSLAVARTDGDGKWVILGILPFFDPPREDSRATLAAADRMGIRVIMATGDQLAIAKETARQLGLRGTVFDARLFESEAPGREAEVDRTLEKAAGFAEVYPEHKFRIVDRLQHHGHFVAMTGDGVNDAPALKKADAGIAVSGATEVARSAADIVLTAPGLSVVVDAIAQSRAIFRRMISYATYRVTETVRVLLFLTFSILAWGLYPVTEAMIVLLALLNDAAILTIAFDRTPRSPRPETWRMRTVLAVATTLGFVGFVESLGVLVWGDRILHLPHETLRTLIYLKLSVAGHLTIFATRTRGPFWSQRPAPVLLAAVLGTQALATGIAVSGILMAPIPWTWAAGIWAYCVAGFLVEDGVKRVVYHVLDGRRRLAPADLPKGTKS